MTTQAILDNILAHRMQDEQTHPDQRSCEIWAKDLRARFSVLTDWIDQTDNLATRHQAAEAAAQLAGHCVRIIEELHLPLIEPNEQT